MDIIKSLSLRVYPIAIVVIFLSGIGVIITAGFLESLALQIGLALGGLAVICLAIIFVKLVHEGSRSQEKLDELMKKIDELREAQQDSGENKSGIAIADVISSSLKFYADYQEKNKTEE